MINAHCTSAGFGTCNQASSIDWGTVGDTMTTCPPSCSRRNSFDLVADMANAMALESSITDQATVCKIPQSTNSTIAAAQQDFRKSIAITLPAPSANSRPFQHESSTRFSSYETIELDVLPVASKTSAVHSSIAAIQPLPAAHVVGSYNMPTDTNSPSPNRKRMADATMKAKAAEFESRAVPSLSDDFMTVLNYFRRR